MINVIDLRQLDLNLLVVFAAVYREKSVKRAAEKLLVGQSAVSMALRRLRELFHDELFVKTASGVEPTSKAIAIEPPLREALELVHRAVYERTEFDPESASGVVRVAMSDDLEMWLLPVLLDRVRTAAPGMTIVVRPSNWYTGLGLVERGEADVALGILPPSGTSLVTEVLFRERFMALFDRRYLREPLTLRRYVSVPHVMLSVAGDLTGVVDEALRVRGAERRVVATVPGFSTLGSLVRGRHLVATLPAMAARHLAASLGLGIATPPIELGPYPFSMVWHAKTDRDPALRWLRGEIAALVRASTPAAPAPMKRRRSPTRRRR